MKLSSSILPAALIGAMLLTGCSGGGSSSNSPTADAAGEDCLAAGEVSKSIKVGGDLGAEDLTLESETPISITDIERSVLIEGEGEVVADGESITASITYFNGNDGTVIGSAPDTSLTLSQVEEELPTWAYEAARCGVPGQRAVIVGTAIDVVGTSPAEAGLENLEDDDAIVTVFDFAVDECEGKLTERDEEFPKVDLGDGSAEPTITITPCMEPPTELEIEVLEEGDGPVVEADQQIMTNYVGVDWNGAERFDGNWSETGIEFSTAEGQLIEGFTQAMVGQKVGSTILVTIPPELGYDDGMTRTFVLQLVSVAEGE